MADTSATPSVILCGASAITRINNFGDRLLLRLFEEWVGEAAPGIRVEMLQYDDRASRRARWTEQFRQASALVFIAGGYFGEPSFSGHGPLGRHVRKWAWGVRNGDLYLKAFRYARKHSIPFAVCGVEVGPVSNIAYRKGITRLLEQAESCIVRTPESESYARAWGVRRPIEVYPDAALALDPSAYRQNASARPGKRDAVFRVGLHAHHLPAGWHADRIIDTVREVVALISNKHAVALHYVHDQTIDGVYPDRSRAAEEYVSAALAVAEPIQYVEPAQLVADLARMDLVITTKLHVGVVARRMNIPVLALPLHNKVPRFYSMIGESDWCVHLTPGSANLPDVLRSALANLGPSQRVCIEPAILRDAAMSKEEVKSFITRSVARS